MGWTAVLYHTGTKSPTRYMIQNWLKKIIHTNTLNGMLQRKTQVYIRETIEIEVIHLHTIN